MIGEPAKLDDSNWDDILNFIKKGECILFVGPETVMKSPGVSYHQELVKSPAFQNNEYFKYIERDEMFLLTQKKHRGRLVSRFKNFCDKNSFFDETYKKIAAIPFRTIILMTRYPFLIKVFEDNNIEFQHRWFSKTFDKSSETEIETPTADVPLIYNIFGNLNNDESLLLTHNDLFDYLKKLLNETALPLQLRELVNSSSQIVFLGFRFDQWYIQLLMRLFQLNDSNAGFERTATLSDEEEDVVNICVTEFNMKFIGENIDSFVDMLYDKCKENGIEYRVPSVPDVNSQVQADVDAINKLIANNEFDNALKKYKELGEKYKQPGVEKNLIQLMGVWNSIKDNIIAGVQSPEDLKLDKNKLRISISMAVEDLGTQIKQ